MQKLIAALEGLTSDQSFVIGSGHDTDFRQMSAGIDGRHARFVRRHQALHVQDLDSGTGTFLNGSEIRGLVAIQPGDEIRIGDLEFVIPNSAVDQAREVQAGAGLSLTVVNAVKMIPGGRRILDRVAFHLEAGQFLGILGASGSGKSTLIKSLAGLADLSEGTVLIQDDAVSAATLSTDRRIAYLPQDVVIHESLTAGTALDYIARLKEIGATPDARLQLVQMVLDRVGLSDRIKVPIHRLSGGQRKRVALAAELLGDPQLLLLDEATSGLDPATEEEMMILFRSLAREGRTVVCITHFPGRLHMCDKLLYMNQGRCTFYGTPRELCQFFDVNAIEDVYTKQNDCSAEDWELLFRESAVGRREAVRIPTVNATTHPAARQTEILTRDGFWRQTRDLTSRYFRLQLADSRNLLLLLSQAPFIAFMIVATYGSIHVSFAELHAANTKEIIFLLVVSVLWCSGTASIREIVKEISILQHETRFGVRLWPYLLSKFSMLGVLSLVQTLVLLWIVRSYTQLSGVFDLQFLVLLLMGLVGVALGLAISAISGTSERAMTVLPVVLIGQAIFSGGLGQLAGTVRVIAMLLSPAYWALDGLRALFTPDLRNATYPGAPGHFQPPILGPGGPLIADLLALILQALVLLGLTWLTLRHATGQVMIPQRFEGVRQLLLGVWRRP